MLSDFLHLAAAWAEGLRDAEVLILCGFASHKLDRPLLLALCVCGELSSMEAVMLKARGTFLSSISQLNGKVQHTTKEDHVLVDRRGASFSWMEGSLELLHRESLDGR